MYEYIIAQYIKALTTEDIKNYAKNQGIQVSDKDALILLKTAKEHWPIFYKGDPTVILAKLKEEIDPKTYTFGLNLYQEMKKKLRI